MRRYISSDPNEPFDDQIAINRALLDEAHLRWGGERGHRSTRGERGGRGGAVSTKTPDSAVTRMEDKPDGRGSNERDANRPLSGEGRWGDRGMVKAGLTAGARADLGRGFLNDDVPLTVALLQQASVPRRCERLSRAQLKGAAVLHCYSGKSGDAKDQAAKRFGTWHLPAEESSGVGSSPPLARTARWLFDAGGVEAAAGGG